MRVVDLTQPMTNGMPVMAGITPPRFHDLAQVRRLPLQKVERGASVVARGCDGLRDFVGERGGQFSHHAQAVHVGEL